jgi:hypothetical protein
LSCAPTGVAERNQGVFRPAAAAYSLEDIARGSHTIGVVYLERRYPLTERSIDNKSPVALHRSAFIDRHVIDLRVRGHYFHLPEHFAQPNRGRPVNDDTHGAFLAMGADQGHGLEKIWIQEARHGDEKVIGEIE